MVKHTSTKYNFNVAPEILSKAKEYLEKINTFEFNVFEVDSIFQKRTLFHVLNEIMHTFNFIEDIFIENKYINFVNEIIDGYDRKIPYHNDLHATDVLQTTYLIITKGDLKKVISFIYF